MPESRTNSARSIAARRRSPTGDRTPDDGSEERGRTLVEQLLVLGIGGVMLAGSTMFAGQVGANLAGDAAVQQTAALLANVKSLYAGAVRYDSGDLAATLAAVGMPLDDRRGMLANAWSGAAVTGKGRTVEVALAGLPASACTRLASTVFGGVVGMTVNGTASPEIPLSPRAAAAACSLPGSGADGGNAIAWTVD